MFICGDCKVKFECGFYEETFKKIFEATEELRVEKEYGLAIAIEDAIFSSNFEECEYKR